jgi:hypothetical protein
MKDSTVLPDLRMLCTADLVPHEEFDPRRIDKLSRRIIEEGILKNPPVVAEMPGSRQYVVLDGANRVISFQELGIPHIVAQLVSYVEPNVVLDTWYHVVSGMSLQEFELALTQMGGMQLEACSLSEARQSLERPKPRDQAALFAAGVTGSPAIAYIVCESGVRKVLHPAMTSVSDLHLLIDLVKVYKGQADIFRASNDIWEIQKPYYPDITALVIFRRYRPEDILHATLNGYRVPSGITRHIIANRALNINIPLGVLQSNWTLERKREWLHDWLMTRMSANAIRFYAESTFSFNE